jgi:signal transduction histidine kinase
VPGGLLPRWKSSYVRLVTAPTGQQFVVGSGIYNDRMERAFVVDIVNDAVAELERRGEAAFTVFRDRRGPFMAKDAYVFVIDPHGIELVNPAFANLEGRNVLDVKDTQGKHLVRSMLQVARTRGQGWVDYMWPKPGEAVSTQKTTYVRTARVGDHWYLVGAGVYLADAPKAPPDPTKLTAPELTSLVHEAAALLAQRGEDALPELRERGTKWFHDDLYFVVWDLHGTRLFHAADPSLEGKDASNVRDAQGRPYGKMFLEVANSPSGEGWVHYMFPEPGNIFPVWKSTYLQRVTFPSGTQYLVGAGIYNMQMDRAFIEDVVNRAAAAISDRGAVALPDIRDKHGPFVFMDTYVFVDRPDGTEIVNPAQPSLEGKNLMDLTDVNGKHVAREYIDAAMANGSAWVAYDWYRPGENTPSHKQTFVRKVVVGPDTYIVGSGLYLQ